jgi:hypothetical protein
MTESVERGVSLEASGHKSVKAAGLAGAWLKARVSCAPYASPPKFAAFSRQRPIARDRRGLLLGGFARE